MCLAQYYEFQAIDWPLAEEKQQADAVAEGKPQRRGGLDGRLAPGPNVVSVAGEDKQPPDKTRAKEHKLEKQAGPVQEVAKQNAEAPKEEAKEPQDKQPRDEQQEGPEQQPPDEAEDKEQEAEEQPQEEKPADEHQESKE